MSYTRGDFVDCAFPFRESPDRPESRRLHIAYVERVLTQSDGVRVIVLYTTTAQRPPGQPKRMGEVDVHDRASQEMGMRRAFTIDAFRILIAPRTERWFPNLPRPGQGLRGRAPEALQRHLTRIFDRALDRKEPLLDIYPRRTK